MIHVLARLEGTYRDLSECVEPLFFFAMFEYSAQQEVHSAAENEFERLMCVPSEADGRAGSRILFRDYFSTSL